MKSRDLKNELETFTQMLEFNKKSRNIIPWKKELNRYPIVGITYKEFDEFQ